MADIVTAYPVMASIVAFTIMAYTGMAYIGMVKVLVGLHFGLTDVCDVQILPVA